MFENLTDKLERSFKILKGEGRITEINVAETLKEIRRALIDADVNYKVAKSFTDQVKQKALGQDVLKAVKPGQMMTKIVRDELAELMGGTATDIRLEGNPAVILIAGLQGSGKTTFSGKLAAFIKSKKGRQVLLVAGDVYRPAAIDQLKVLGGQIGVEVYTEEGNKNPVQIAENAIKIGLAAVVTNFGKKNLYHTSWKKKLIGIALIYLAPFVLKFLREKLEEYEEREVLKSLEEIL